MKRGAVAFLTGCALAAGVVALASAQEWPTRPIRIVVAFGPGGGTDIIVMAREFRRDNGTSRAAAR